MNRAVGQVSTGVAVGAGHQGQRVVETVSGGFVRGVARADLQAVLVVSLAASGIIHLGVTPAHLREYTAFGVFFIVAAVAQLAAGWWCGRRASRVSVGVALVLSAVIAAVWVVSRTTGLPIGPEAGEAESVGLADVVSTIYELVSVASATALVIAVDRGERLRMRWTPRSATWATFAVWITVGAVFASGH